MAFGRRKKGTLEKLLDKQQKAELKAARKEEARKKKIEDLKKKAELARAERSLKSARKSSGKAKPLKLKNPLRVPLKKKKQGGTLKRNMRIKLL